MAVYKILDIDYSFDCQVPASLAYHRRRYLRTHVKMSPDYIRTNYIYSSHQSSDGGSHFVTNVRVSITICAPTTTFLHPGHLKP